MKLQLPKNKTESKEIEIETNSLVIVGANGSGKTRFSTNLEKNYNNITHRISAQKSLSMPSGVQPETKEKAEAEFLYGHFYENDIDFSKRNKYRNSYMDNPNTSLLNDYD